MGLVALPIKDIRAVSIKDMRTVGRKQARIRVAVGCSADERQVERTVDTRIGSGKPVVFRGCTSGQLVGVRQAGIVTLETAKGIVKIEIVVVGQPLFKHYLQSLILTLRFVVRFLISEILQ